MNLRMEVQLPTTPTNTPAPIKINSAKPVTAKPAAEKAAPAKAAEEKAPDYRGDPRPHAGSYAARHRPAG